MHTQTLSCLSTCKPEWKKYCIRSARAGLQFPIGRVHRLLRQGNYAETVGAAGHPSLPGGRHGTRRRVAGNAVRDDNKQRINPAIFNLPSGTHLWAVIFFRGESLTARRQRLTSQCLL